MVYNWEPHKDECYRLYVEENKSLDEVIEFMRREHDFTPSRRGFQSQFSRWKFPAKHNPAYKNEPLVARVRELWERNLTQKEMLRVLVEEDGFQVGNREVTRLRQKLGLRLRENHENLSAKAQPNTVYLRQQSLRSESAGGGGDDSDDSDDDDDDAEEGSGNHDPEDSIPTADLTPEQLARRAERKRALEIESQQKWATKKRRRRTRGWAGLPADPPGPPRFPSETTLTEARDLLQLSDETYKSMRQEFQSICEEAGVVKKTLAGPEKWESLKEQLIRQSMHLRAVMWDQENTDKKRLAIDVIACDVTKRMRVAESQMTLAEARRVLGLNPEQGREMRFSLHRILADDGFTCKHEEGQEHWEEVKRRWLAEMPEPLRQLLVGAEGTTGTDQPIKVKALNHVARDAVRRYRDYTGQKGKGKKPAATPKPAKVKGKRTDSASDVDTLDLTEFETAAGQLPVPGPTTPNRQQRQSRSTPTPHAVLAVHSEARFLPAAGIEEQQQQQQQQQEAAHLSSMDARLGTSSMLMAANVGQNPFLDGPSYVQVQGYAPPAPQVYHQHHQHHQSTSSSSPMAVYFRLHPASAPLLLTVTPGMWITTLDNPRSINELRTAAVDKCPGFMCIAIEGIIKDGKGGELPLSVNDDVELDAYLRHLQSQGVSTPTFSVQLITAASAHREWV